MTALSGNAAAYLVPLLALRHPATVALGAGVKLSPALLAPASGVRRVIPWIAVFGVVSFLGAGIDNHLDWLRSVPSSAPSPASVAGLTGLPPWLVLAGCIVLSLFGWPAGVVAATFATPVVYFSTLVLLILLVTPRPGTQLDRAVSSSQGKAEVASGWPRHQARPSQARSAVEVRSPHPPQERP